MSAHEAKNAFGQVIDTARAEPVLNEKHGRGVVMVVFITRRDSFAVTQPNEASMFGWGKKDHKTRPVGPEKPATSIPTVKFDPTRVTDAVLVENIRALPEVGANDFETVYQAAVRATSVGGALNIIYAVLMDIEGMPKRRAEDISRSLNFKAKAIMNAEQQTKLGIKYATWLYSGAPCRVNPKQPDGEDQDAAHKATANGKPFLISKGMFLNGEWTWPGRKEGCKCGSKSMIAGFDGYDGGKPKGLLE